MLNQKALDTKMLKEKTLYVATGSGSANVPANGNAGIAVTIPTVSNYTPIGILGVANDHGAHFCITDYHMIDTSSALVVLRNVSSSAQNVTITCSFLYIISTRT